SIRATMAWSFEVAPERLVSPCAAGPDSPEARPAIRRRAAARDGRRRRRPGVTTTHSYRIAQSAVNLTNGRVREKGVSGRVSGLRTDLVGEGGDALRDLDPVARLGDALVEPSAHPRVAGNPGPHPDREHD